MNYPYHVGYGLCNNDFSITETGVATFNLLEDAKSYVILKKDNDNFILSNRIYYIDDMEKQSRYIYDAGQHKFIEGNDIVSFRKKIYIPGYEVSAVFVNDEEEDDYYYEKTVCLSYSTAEQEKQQYLEDGADEVEIEDADVGVRENFRSSKFFLGDFEASNQQEQYDELDR